MLSSIFRNSPPGSTVWSEDSASAVHDTDSGKFVYNKRRPLPAKAFLLIGDGKKLKVECFESLGVVLHCKDDVRMTLETVAVVLGLAFDLMYFNCIQKKRDILVNRDGTWILNGRVHFVKLQAGNYIQATRVEHGAGPPAMVPAMMRPGQQRSINSNDLHISLAHTNDANARETAKQMGIKVTGTWDTATTVARRRRSGAPSRAPFVGEVPTWGSGAVVDTAAAAVVAAPSPARVAGSGVFPAASARKAAGAPASATGAAASAAATATAAAATAAIPPDRAGGTVAARGGISPTPPVDWTTARHDQRPETATTQRRRYQVTPAGTRSGLWRTGMSEAFALLEAYENILSPPDRRRTVTPNCQRLWLATPETYTQAHAGPHGRNWGAAERKEFTGLPANGTS